MGGANERGTVMSPRIASPRFWLIALLAVLALPAMGSCQLPDSAGSQSSAIHGTGDAAPSNDSASLAVGEINVFGDSCAASLVAEDSTGGIGLTAAHCISPLGQRCATESQVMNGAVFALSTTGSLLYGLSDAADLL